MGGVKWSSKTLQNSLQSIEYCVKSLRILYSTYTLRQTLTLKKETHIQ